MSALHDFLHHPIESLEKALHIRKQLEALQKELASILGSNPPAVAALQVFAPEDKRIVSAAARAKMAAAQKARWAKKAVPVSPRVKAAPGTKARKSKFSAAHRAKLKAAAKARWAKVEKAEAKIANEGQPKFRLF